MKNTIIFTILFVIMAGFASASLELDDINFDPAIIAAGDQVDIVIQFHADSFSDTESKIGNPDYRFEVKLKPDDTLTQNYVIMEDSSGDDTHGSLLSGSLYSKKFRVKVKNDAPAGNYEFKLEGRWYKNEVAESSSQSLKFIMPVKKEGIIIDIANIDTVPSEVRPGDNYVKLNTFIENVGQKDSKSVEVKLMLPEGLESSYTNNNRVWAGRVNAGESKEISFFLDVDEEAEDKIYDIEYEITYLDLDDNKYEKSKSVPFLVKPRPYLEVVKTSGEGKAGEKSKLYVVVENTGKESAESVDVRIIKQNSQPFTMDVRSDYIGELEPGEKGVAVFDIGVNGDAEIKEHDFKIVIRSKGDSDEGDDTIYTYNRRAKFKVTGKAGNPLLIVGILGGVAIIGYLIFRRVTRRKKR